MLVNLSINNFAIFEKVNLNFSKGFNVITGETGSGKSILLESILILLGLRVRKDFIRKGTNSAIIEAVFDITNNNNISKLLTEHGIVIDEDNLILISKELLNSGKSISKINDRNVTLSFLRKISSYFIDVYGQFGQYSILKKENHIKMIDEIKSKEIKEIKKKYNDVFDKYNIVNDKIIDLENNFTNKDSRIKQLEYEINEIDSVNIKKDEEESLLKEIKKLSNIEEIKNSLDEFVFLINDSESSVMNNMTNLSKLLYKLKNYDKELFNNNSKLEVIIENIQELLFSMINYKENIDVDTERINFIEERIALINRLKRKYGFSYDNINEYRNIANDELLKLTNISDDLCSLKIEKKEMHKRLEKLSYELTSIRKESIKYLEANIIKELDDLNMKNVEFEVKITQKNNFTSNGIDDIEFLISTNIGSDLKPLHKIVSGGETSRIMLAFKKIMADKEHYPTLIFDEIDTGISGRTSQMVGEKMNYMSKCCQVICITHSPQVASISNHHFLIKKSFSKDSTFSTIKNLNGQEKSIEIARLLSGLKITDKSINNAQELINISNKI